MMICCSLDAFMNHSLPFEKLIIMCLGVGIFEVILPGAVELLGCLYSCLSSNLGCFQPLFLQIFFLPFLSLFSFWNSHKAYLGPFYGVPYVSKDLFVFFFFCSTALITSIVLSLSSLIHSSACLNLPLNPSSEFFHFNYYTIQFQNFILVSF